MKSESLFLQKKLNGLLTHHIVVDPLRHPNDIIKLRKLIESSSDVLETIVIRQPNSLLASFANVPLQDVPISNLNFDF